MPGFDYFETNEKNTPANKQHVEKTNVVLGIENIEKWDCYSLSDIKTNLFDIPKYYETVLSRRGYQVNYNYYNPQNKSGGYIFSLQNKKIYVAYSVNGDKRPVIIVFYQGY